MRRNWAVVSRLIMAVGLYYVVAVLYSGTMGSTGGQVFVRPLIGTAIFTTVLCGPVLVGWLVTVFVARPAKAEPSDQLAESAA